MFCFDFFFVFVHLFHFFFKCQCTCIWTGWQCSYPDAWSRHANRPSCVNGVLETIALGEVCPSLYPHSPQIPKDFPNNSGGLCTERNLKITTKISKLIRCNTESGSHQHSRLHRYYRKPHEKMYNLPSFFLCWYIVWNLNEKKFFFLFSSFAWTQI